MSHWTTVRESALKSKVRKQENLRCRAPTLRLVLFGRQFQNDWDTLIDEALALTAQRRATFFSPHSATCRFLVLFLVCVLVIGPYCAYDSIGANQLALEKDLGISAQEFSYLYAVYSVPNIVLVFAGGLLLDKIGLMRSTLLFALLVFLGSSLVAAASQIFHSFPLMIAGRALYGIGSESCFVAQNAIIASWFAGRESGLAMGLGVAAGRIGTFLAFSVNSWIVNLFGFYQAGLWFAAGLCGLSVVAAVLYGVIDFMGHARGGLKADIGDPSLAPKEDEAGFFASIFSFGGAFWLAAIVAATYQSSVGPFQGFSTGLLQKQYGMDAGSAGQTTSIIAGVSLFLSPAFGLAADKLGRRVVFVFLGTALLAGGFGAIAFIPLQSPTPYYVVVGVAYALIPSALWPALPLVVPREKVGSAFGLAAALVNLTEMTSYQVAGYLADHVGLSILPRFFCGLSSVALSAALLWNVVDYYTGGRANIKPQ